MTINEVVCKNGRIMYKDAKTGYIVAKAIVDQMKAAEAYQTAAINKAGVALADAANKLDVAQHVAVKMAFHMDLSIITDPETQNLTVQVKYRTPRVSSEAYDAEKFFDPSEARTYIETFIDRPYGIATFEAQGEDETKLMGERVKKLVREGWTSPNGMKFTPIYAYYIAKGFLLFVEDRGDRPAIDLLNITLSSSGKTAKRARRLFAPYQDSLVGEIIDRGRAPEGAWYEVELKGGAVLKVLVADMSKMSPKAQALVTGMNISLVNEFINKALTVQSKYFHAKGHYWRFSWMTNYDLWLFDVKDEVRIKDNKFFLGSLHDLEGHKLTMDVQTMVNMGLGASELVPKHGLWLLNEMAEVLHGIPEEPRLDLLSSMVNVAKSADQEARWTLVDAAQKGIGFNCGIAAVSRRLSLHAFKDLVDLDRGRTPLPENWAKRLYACPNPQIFVNDSRIVDLDSCQLSEIARNKPRTLFGVQVHYVCAPDMPEGFLAAGRSPNACGAEAVILFNIHLSSLMRYEGWGCVFVAAEDGGELMHKLNGGDFDDQLWVISNPHFVQQVALHIASYPVQPKIETAKQPKETDLQRRNDIRHNGWSEHWTWNWNFREEMKKFTSYQLSLGTFINDLSRDNLHSGQYLIEQIQKLEAGDYILPANFRAPERFELESKDEKRRMLPDWFIPLIPKDYEPTEKKFVALCIQFLKVHGGYRCAEAASNADVVIDFIMQGAGDYNSVIGLINQAKQSRLNPVIPELVRNMHRVPGARSLDGCYIIVRTTACEAIHVMRVRQEEILNESRRMEWVWKQQLPERVRMAYPSDEMVETAVSCMRTWRTKEFDRLNSLTKNDWDRKEIFNKVSNGWDELKLDKDGLATVVRHPGLKDYFTTQFHGDMELHPEQGKWSTEMQRKFVVHWLSNVYAYNPPSNMDGDGQYRSVGDGLPNFMFNMLFDVFEELEMTGHTVFMDLKQRVRNTLNQKNVRIQVDAIDGHVYNVTDMQQLSRYADPNLPDGRYFMTPSGVIRVRLADRELRSDRLAKAAAAMAAGDNTQFDF